LTASFARMQGRAEAIALSGPHATGVPVRIAEQKRWISMRIGRGPVPVLDAVDADAVLVFRFPAIVSEDCATAAPSRGPGERAQAHSARTAKAWGFTPPTGAAPWFLSRKVRGTPPARSVASLRAPDLSGWLHVELQTGRPPINALRAPNRPAASSGR